jgi:predicted nucleotide-binding protein (sugar kinase/HSP70/actin superfamily)
MSWRDLVWRDKTQPRAAFESLHGNRPRFIVPCFSDVQCAEFGPFLTRLGYYLLPVNAVDDAVRDYCLSLSNNDLCYSMLHLIGQVVSANQADASLLEETTVILPSFCVDCRCDEAPYLLEKILEKLGYKTCKVISLKKHLDNLSSGENLWDNASVQQFCCLLCVRDVLQQLFLRLEPYCTSETLSKIVNDCRTLLEAAHPQMTPETLPKIITSLLDKNIGFVPDLEQRLPTVGVVGTYPLLFCESINNELFSRIQKEGCEVQVPYSSDFILHFLKQGTAFSQFCAAELEKARASTEEALAQYASYLARPVLLKHYCLSSVPRHLVCGAGWSLSAAISKMAEQDIKNILYIRSFGCLCGPSLGQGLMKTLRGRYPHMNIVSIEYDLGTSEVNQDNRVKLLTTLSKGLTKTGHEKYWFTEQAYDKRVKGDEDDSQ